MSETERGSMIEFQDVAVGYGSQAILRGLNFSIGAGQITGLLGANGSGKSTVLKTIVGIIPALAGRIVFRGTSGNRPAVGYVPQRETLGGWFLLSTFDVALMGCYGRLPPGLPVPRAEKEFVSDCLRKTEAEAFAGKSFAELSGGQRQRVLIARALATRPELLVLDEPMTGLDATAAEAIAELLRMLHQTQQLTILLVNHDLRTTRQLVDQVVWLHQGRALTGPVSELLSARHVQQMLEREFSL